MRPETIKKIIAEGTPKKRVELYFEHYSSLITGGAGILSKEEEGALYEAIGTSEKAVQVYKKAERQFNKLREAYHYLFKLYIAFTGAVDIIRQRYIFSFVYIRDFDTIMGTLNELLPRREDRETFVTNFLTRQHYLPQFDYKFTVEPVFSVKIELGFNQTSYINSQKEAAIQNLIKAKAYFRALDEYMETNKITSKAYKETFSSLRAKFDSKRYLVEPPLDYDCFKIPLLEDVLFSKLSYEYNKGDFSVP